AFGDKLYLSIYKRDNGAELYTTSLEDLVLSNNIENNTITKTDIIVYPNPTDGELDVLMSDKSNIKNISIYDLAGKFIKGNDFNSQSHIKFNTQNLPKGIYLLSVETINGKFDKKIIVK